MKLRSSSFFSSPLPLPLPLSPSTSTSCRLIRFSSSPLPSRSSSLLSLRSVSPLFSRSFVSDRVRAKLKLNASFVASRPVKAEPAEVVPRDQAEILQLLRLVRVHPKASSASTSTSTDLTEFASKFSSWSHLIDSDNRTLRACGLNVKQRKALLRAREEYKSRHSRRDLLSALDSLGQRGQRNSEGEVEVEGEQLSGAQLQEKLFEIEYADVYARQWRVAEEKEAEGWWRKEVAFARLRKKSVRNEWNGIQDTNTLPSLAPMRNPEAAKEMLQAEIGKLEAIAEDDELRDLHDEVHLLEDEVFNEEQLNPILESMYEKERKKILTDEARIDEYTQAILHGTEMSLGLVPITSMEKHMAKLEKEKKKAKADRIKEKMEGEEEEEEEDDHVEDNNTEKTKQEGKEERIEASNQLKDMKGPRQSEETEQSDGDSTELVFMDAEKGLVPSMYLEVEESDDDTEICENARQKFLKELQESYTDPEFELLGMKQKELESVQEELSHELFDSYVGIELGDVEHPMVDHLRDIGMPVVSLNEIPFDPSEVDEEEFDENMVEYMDEIEEEARKNFYDTSRPLHPYVEHDIKQRINTAFWNYSAEEDQQTAAARALPHGKDLPKEEYILKDGESVEDWFARHGMDPDVFAAYDREAQRMMTGYGLAVPKLEEEPNQEEDNYVLEYVTSKFSSSDDEVEEDVDEDDEEPAVNNQEIEAQTTIWKLDPAEELREHILRTPDPGSSSTQIPPIIENQAQVKQALLNEIEEARAVPKIVADTMQDAEKLRIINRRRLNKMFKLKP